MGRGFAAQAELEGGRGGWKGVSAAGRGGMNESMEHVASIPIWGEHDGRGSGALSITTAAATPVPSGPSRGCEMGVYCAGTDSGWVNGREVGCSGSVGCASVRVCSSAGLYCGAEVSCAVTGCERVVSGCAVRVSVAGGFSAGFDEDVSAAHGAVSEGGL